MQFLAYLLLWPDLPVAAGLFRRFPEVPFRAGQVRSIMRELLLVRRNALIMRPERYDPEALIRLLRQRKIATMDDLKEALGTRRTPRCSASWPSWITAPATAIGAGTTPWTRSPASTSWGCGRSARCGSPASARWCRPSRRWWPPPRPATTRRSWRRCCTSRPSRPCSSWCAPGAWPASRWPAATCTSRPGRGPPCPAGGPLGL